MGAHYKAYYQSPIGHIEISGTKGGVVSLDFMDKAHEDDSRNPSCLEESIRQLDLYFKGKLKDFSVTLEPHGTHFQQRVWSQLRKIPFGETRSYAEIAALLGNPQANRAVGNATGKNNIAIMIPCHRVIGSDGHLTGYASGLWRKEWLLNHERDVLSGK